MNYWDAYSDRWDVYSDRCKGMSTEEMLWNGCMSGVCMAAAIVVLLVLCALTSCTTTKYVNVPEMHTDTLYISKMQRDSIWLHDSIHVTERQQGDTFFVEVAKWKTKYIERLRTDTLIEHHTDSIPYPVEVVKEVPRKLTWWQQTRIHCGEFLLAIVGIALIIVIIGTTRKFWL